LAKNSLNILNEEWDKASERIRSRIERQILNNFDQEKDVDGNPFHPLTGTTKKIRREKGTWPGKILNETGKLRSGLKVSYIPVTKEWKVEANTDYARELNYGRSNMQPRKFLEIPKNWAGGKDYQREFNKFARNLFERIGKKLEKDIFDI
tara:strand:+ start:3696 stop:4145 length:450 start_codon:yes stop_codon:yes gene_type:complete